jgi:hypothetical protein
MTAAPASSEAALPPLGLLPPLLPVGPLVERRAAMAEAVAVPSMRCASSTWKLSLGLNDRDRERAPLPMPVGRYPVGSAAEGRGPRHFAVTEEDARHLFVFFEWHTPFCFGTIVRINPRIRIPCSYFYPTGCLALVT